MNFAFSQELSANFFKDSVTDVTFGTSYSQNYLKITSSTDDQSSSVTIKFATVEQLDHTLKLIEKLIEKRAESPGQFYVTTYSYEVKDTEE
jgi:hypothetical protein